MAIDPSIFAQANKPTTLMNDPSQQLAQMAQAQNAVNQNKLFQSGQARGELMQQAIDPSTGQFSPSQFNRLLSQDPRAALSAPEAVGQSQGLMGSQYDLAAKRNDFLSSAIGAALKAPDDQIHQIALDSLSRGVDMGLLTPQDAIKQGLLLSNNPTGLRQQLTQIQMSRMSPQGQRDATYGTPATRDTGQGIESGNVMQDQGSGFRPTTTTDVYPSRGQLAGQQTGVGPDTAPTSITTADRLSDQGRSDLAGPAGTRPGQLPSKLLPPGYTGRYAPGGGGAAQPPPGPGLQPAATPSRPPPTPMGGAVTVGLPPGTVNEAEASVGHASLARDAANTYQTRMQPLQAAQIALANTKTGSGAATLNSIRQRLESFTPAMFDGFRLAGGSVEADAAFDEARKYLTQYASNTPGGNRSDAGGQTAKDSNASVDISPMAARMVVQAAMGMERMKQAQTMEFNASGKTGGQYDRFQSQLATNADPRAFVSDMQTPDERTAIIGKLRAQKAAGNAAPLNNYVASLRLGMKHGLLPAGGQ